MGGKVSVYDVGGGGVNLVKGPLQLADNEATQLQNAEFVPDAGSGGAGVLSKRGGLQPLNGSALAGSVVGMAMVNLRTTYTRTLYAGKGTQNSNTWMTTLDGTTWTNVTAPLVSGDIDKFTDANGLRDARRIAAIKNFILYPGNAYTKGTDQPPVALWDGTNALTVTSIPVGPSATAATPAYAVTDMMVANGVLYLAIHDPGGSAPSLAGRVLSLDLETGAVTQIANAFGNGTGDTTGGYPSSLCWYQDSLYVGLQGNTTTDGIGKVVRCIPSIDTVWTSDVANLSGFPSSVAVFQGDLYVGTQSSTSSNAKVYKRAATTGAYVASFTSAAGASGTSYVTSLIVYGGELYAIEYYSGGTDVVHIKKWDGSSWTTDRDVDNLDSLTDPPQPPGMSALYGSDLYFSLRANSVSAADGMMFRKTAGSWSKVKTDNFNGNLAVLVERS